VVPRHLEVLRHLQKAAAVARNLHHQAVDLRRRTLRRRTLHRHTLRHHTHRRHTLHHHIRLLPLVLLLTVALRPTTAPHRTVVHRLALDGILAPQVRQVQNQINSTHNDLKNS
jgi:hypothetical protein